MTSTTMLKETTRMKAWWFAVAVIVIDQITKLATVMMLPLMRAGSNHYPYGGVGIFSNFLGVEFSLVHQTNFGAAWGIFADHTMLLLVARIILVLALVVYAVAYNSHRSWDIPLALVVGGALANISDILTYGHVIDMFYFVFWGYDYPVFNVADSAICVGITWLFILSFKGEKETEPR